MTSPRSRLLLWGILAIAVTAAVAVVVATRQPGSVASGSSTSDPGGTECFGSDEVTAAREARAEAFVPPVEGDLPRPEPRFDDIVEALTGERQTGDEDPVQDTIDDPNYGGVWGDRRGGVVVAILNCSAVDIAELTRLAGGREYLLVIEVHHSFQQVNGFRDVLRDELQQADINGVVTIDSTQWGRLITIHIAVPDELPATFGATVPDDAYTVVHVDGIGVGQSQPSGG